MDTIAIDAGSAFVDLAKWDGRELRIERLPAGEPVEALRQWIELLCPSAGFRFRFRSPLPQYEDTRNRGRLLEIAKDLGAKDTTWFSSCFGISPAMQAARMQADRYRIRTVAAIEVRATDANLLLIDSLRHFALPRTICWRSKAGLADEPAFLAELRDWLHRASDYEGAPVIMCFGGVGPAIIPSLADALGLSQIIVPELAGCMGLVGMIFGSPILVFRETLPDGAIDMATIRGAIGRLMDRAAKGVMQEGYDLDDIHCERLIELSDEHSIGPVWVACPSLTDEAPLHLNYGKVRGPARSTVAPRRLRMHRTCVRVMFDAPSHSLPSIKAVKTSAAGIAFRDIPSAFEDFRIVERDGLSIDSALDGPIQIRDLFSVTIVPFGWHATLQSAGGILLARRGPA